MSGNPVSLANKMALFAKQEPGVCVGKIIEVTPEGKPIVTFPIAPNGRVFARVVQNLPRMSNWLGSAVLIIFEDDDPGKPIIIGIVGDALPTSTTEMIVDTQINDNQPVKISGKILHFEGEQEIVLRCGLGSIIVRADGQVIIKGTRLMSRASVTNKVRGPSVLIN